MGESPRKLLIYEKIHLVGSGTINDRAKIDR